MEPQSDELSIEFQPLRPKKACKYVPTNLTYNIIATYNMKIYLFGGNSPNNKSFDEYFKNVYIYDPEESTWTKKEFTVPEENEERMDEDENQQSIYSRFNQSWCQVGKTLYIFGGSNYQNQNNKELHVFDLEEIEWKLIKSVKQPQPREGAAMTSINDKYLVLFGGINMKSLQLYEKLWIFDIQSQSWFEGKGQFSSIFKVRPKFSMCALNNDLYCFGGQTFNQKGQTRYLNDLHIFKANWSTYQFSAEFIRAIDKQEPTPRSLPALIPLYDKYILLIGGEVGCPNKDEIEYCNTIQIYNVELRVWKRVQNNLYMSRLSTYSCAGDSSGQIYIIGMPESTGIGKGMITQKKLQKYFESTEKSLNEYCQFCPIMCENQFVISKALVDEVLQLLDFPFSAFGLLIENAINHHASVINIRHEDGQEPIIKVHENNDINYEYHELLTTFTDFNCMLNFSFNNMEKKVKQLILREINLQEYGLFIKLAALRLGDQFLYISTNHLLDMFVFTFELSECGTYYQCYWFIYYLRSESLSSESNKAHYDHVMGKYQPDIQAAIDIVKKQNIKDSQQQSDRKFNKFYINTLVIKKLKMIQAKDSPNKIYELAPSTENVDLINSTYRNLKKSIVKDSIDISLVSYISLLFLKNQSLKITLSVGSKTIKIYTQMYLDTIDKMVRNKIIYEMDNAYLGIEQIKTLQLYYNPDLTIQTGCFHNGVLIYHRNRLIRRHGSPLGHLYQRINSGQHNYFNLFGVIEVPEAVTPNTFKTDFMYNIMMEKIQSRIYQIEEILKRHGQNIRMKIHKKYKGRNMDERGQNIMDGGFDLLIPKQ